MVSFTAFIIYIFLFISLNMLLLSFLLLTFENPIYAIFFLVLVFFGSSFLLIELDLFFLSLMILIVYLGALIVLFLFVVMMLNIRSLELNRTINFFPFLFIFFFSFFLFLISYGFSFGFELYNTLFNFSFYFFDFWVHVYISFTSFLSVGFFLYTFGSCFLILVSLILLVAMLGAIVLTLNQPRGVNRQSSIDQITQRYYLELFN